jgi:CheY-like chemotaxis protein
MNTPPIGILVVDDDPDLLFGTVKVLQNAGYTTATAHNGIEALATTQTFFPDLILSDFDMPGMDGLELCRRIKRDPALANTYVVIISGTHTLLEHQVTGLEAGADGYILRPIGPRELLARVEAFSRIVHLNQALAEKNAELAAALAKVKSLSGLLPICSGCKQIRDHAGYWSRVERYVEEHSDATFTHSLCPDCVKKYFPKLDSDHLGKP